MVLDPGAIQQIVGALAQPGASKQRRGDIGATFQIALLAAAEGNDLEAANCLRRIIREMKTMALKDTDDAGASEDT